MSIEIDRSNYCDNEIERSNAVRTSIFLRLLNYIFVLNTGGIIAASAAYFKIKSLAKPGPTENPKLMLGVIFVFFVGSVLVMLHSLLEYKYVDKKLRAAIEARKIWHDTGKDQDWVKVQDTLSFNYGAERKLTFVVSSSIIVFVLGAILGILAI